MRYRITFLLLFCMIPLMQAQLPVITPEAENTAALVRFLASLPTEALEGLTGKPGPKVADLSDPTKARKILKSALDKARASNSLRQQVKQIIGTSSLPLLASSALELKVKQERDAAAKLPAVAQNQSPFQSVEGNSREKWPSSGLANTATSASRTTLTPSVGTIGYNIEGPITLAYTRVKVRSLVVYGTKDDLVDYLLRSGLFDCNCALLPAAECNLSLMKGVQIPVDAQDAPVMDHRIKLLLRPDDFVSIYNSLPRSQVQLSKALQEGIEKGSRFRHETETLPEEENGTKEAKPTAQEEGTSACEKEYKVCMTPTGTPSMVLGCEGKGEVEIDTTGQISFSMSLGAKQLKATRKEK